MAAGKDQGWRFEAPEAPVHEVALTCPPRYDPASPYKEVRDK